MAKLGENLQRGLSNWRAQRQETRARNAEDYQRFAQARQLERNALIYIKPEDFGINRDDQVVIRTVVENVDHTERRETLEELTRKSPDFLESVAQLVVSNAFQPADEIREQVQVTPDDLRELLLDHKDEPEPTNEPTPEPELPDEPEVVPEPAPFIPKPREKTPDSLHGRPDDQFFIPPAWRLPEQQRVTAPIPDTMSPKSSLHLGHEDAIPWQREIPETGGIHLGDDEAWSARLDRQEGR